MKKTNKIYLTDDDIHKDVSKLIKKIRKYNFEDNVAIIAIARGGLLPAQYISYALGIRDVFVINSKTYNGTQKGDQEISNLFSVDFENYQNFIVVDDIYDSGETMDGVIFALEQVASAMDAKCNFIPAVIHAQKSKKYLDKANITYGRKFKDSPWIVYPWDHYSDEF
jgi:hypoxanthine phosphoribosyltransferase